MSVYLVALGTGQTTSSSPPCHPDLFKTVLSWSPCAEGHTPNCSESQRPVIRSTCLPILHSLVHSHWHLPCPNPTHAGVPSSQTWLVLFFLPLKGIRPIRKDPASSLKPSLANQASRLSSLPL